MAALLGGAVFIRAWAVPVSAGPDIAQYWAFAKVFKDTGLDFYRLAGGSGYMFPFDGWSFVYPPVWLLIIRAGLAAVPASFASVFIITTDWRIVEKAPIILADIIIGFLIYRFVPGSRLKKAIFASLWLFSPAVWYQSAVFGQFDAIAAAFLLGAVLLLERGRDWPAFILAGLAVMTKQHTLIPVMVMMFAWLPSAGGRRFTRGIAVMAGVAVLLSLPFMLTGNVRDYFYYILFCAHSPGYQEPLSYTFNGIAAVLTHLHNVFGWPLSDYFIYFIPVLVAALAGGAVLVYRQRISPARAALIGFLVFLAFFYRINFQYLVIFIPLALYVAATTSHRSERIFLMVMALLPSAWLWLFDIGFWFEQYLPVDAAALEILELLALRRTGTPDLWFVILSGVLWLFFVTYVAGVFCRWRKPPDSGPERGFASSKP